MSPAAGILVRVGIDATYGHWNAPADPRSGEFVYVPIPEPRTVRPGQIRHYSMVLPALRSFCEPRDLDLASDLKFPAPLHDAAMHLDPDFEHLTYGDNGRRRGSQIRLLQRGDLLVFYAGMRSVVDRSLIYGIVGLLTVDDILAAGEVSEHRLGENAHTRRLSPDPDEIVVRGVRGQSGRLTRYLPIGEWRDGAYRVRPDLLDAWGGLSVRDGYIQRSARPPRFVAPGRFREWVARQGVSLIERNN